MQSTIKENNPTQLKKYHGDYSLPSFHIFNSHVRPPFSCYDYTFVTKCPRKKKRTSLIAFYSHECSIKRNRTCNAKLVENVLAVEFLMISHLKLRKYTEGHI